jgi:hypothetical protein
MPTSNVPPQSLADDLLTGCDEIAAYLGWPVRRVFHAASRGALPVAKVGPRWIARKSELSRVLSAGLARAMEGPRG